jgi:hypothetical protein
VEKLTISANKMVTGRRSKPVGGIVRLGACVGRFDSVFGGDESSGEGRKAPHCAQNVASSELVVPQVGHITGKGAPQLEQYFAPVGVSASHFGQRIPLPASID